MGGAQFEAPESPLPFTGQWRTRSALTAAASAVRAPVAATWGRAKEDILYGKIFASMWDGTIATKWPVWSTFVYMIANCDRDGVIEKTPEAISAASGIPLDEVEKAIAHLEAPDPRSRTREHEGRRIERLEPSRDWGWKILNYKHYRGLRDEETRREQNRQAQKRRRDSQQESAAVSHGQPPSAHAEAEADVEADTSPSESPPSAKRKRQPRRTPVLTISAEQREAACSRYELDRETVDSLADRIELEAQAGKYVSAPGALHTYCRNEVRFRSERGNGYVEPPSPWPDEVTR